MSVRKQVEDARFLAQNGRYVGALTILMLAVAASSRKVFPKGNTKSFKKPKENMRDDEAFTQFLGGRIQKILLGAPGDSDYGRSGLAVGFKGAQYDVEYLLYKYYRCELIHEGTLPEDVEFVPVNGNTSDRAGISVSISCGDKLVLDHGWIDLLIEAVVGAKCNGAEFGIKHFELIPNAGIDDDAFSQDVVERYGITPGRFDILKGVVKLLSDEVISQASSPEICALFLELVHSGKVNGGAITGLSTRGVTDRGGRLQPPGVAILREIAAAYQVVEV